jgi:hypothetical protein
MALAVSSNPTTPKESWADLEPMIVPPAAVKSPYYSNAALKATWRIASERLAEAEELVMMGFSLPPTDLIVSSLLATTRRDDIQLTPVNPKTAIVDRLHEALQIPHAQIRADFAGISDPVRVWVDANVK